MLWLNITMPDGFEVIASSPPKQHRRCSPGWRQMISRITGACHRQGGFLSTRSARRHRLHAASLRARNAYGSFLFHRSSQDCSSEDDLTGAHHSSRASLLLRITRISAQRFHRRSSVVVYSTTCSMRAMIIFTQNTRAFMLSSMPPDDDMQPPADFAKSRFRDIGFSLRNSRSPKWWCDYSRREPEYHSPSHLIPSYIAYIVGWLLRLQIMSLIWIDRRRRPPAMILSAPARYSHLLVVIAYA